MRILLPFALALGSFTAVAQIPAAIISDPPFSKTNPVSMDQLAIPSHGANLNGLIHVAAAARRNPTAILPEESGARRHQKR